MRNGMQAAKTKDVKGQLSPLVLGMLFSTAIWRFAARRDLSYQKNLRK
ncbi:hypothetical protein [Effusibacillus consociatus]|uniref:Uncharacterized protein n=1 Tax=Effusibacillus consociatus TaxID=1117041 RepID=A0ABV9Q0D6_9BACL